ncbi:MAG: DUF1189 family protein [Clostridia bacterium]|nr:DUF1189 family protein [Clostridia bacterium]
MIVKDFSIAIGNFKKYRELLKRRVGDIIVYVTALMLVCSIGLIIIPTVVQSGKIINGLMQELPDFTLSSAEGLTVAEQFDFEFAGIKLLATNEKDLTEADFGDCAAGVLMDKNKVLMRNFGQTFSFDYKEFDMDGKGFEISKSSLPQYRRYYYLLACIFAFSLLISYAFSYVMDGLLIALISSVICMLMRVRIGITELVKLAMYSQTLPLVLSAVMFPFGIHMNTYISLAFSVIIIALAMNQKRADEAYLP